MQAGKNECINPDPGNLSWKVLGLLLSGFLWLIFKAQVS
jgi:hypothetical protein